MGKHFSVNPCCSWYPVSLCSELLVTKAIASVTELKTRVRGSHARSPEARKNGGGEGKKAEMP